MPVPNDFRLNGALGGLVASQEYMAEQEKQQLANALTQAQTAGHQQQTGQLEALLPLLLEQRKQENTIRERQAGLAQATMGNIPQEAANQGLAGILTGMQTQGSIDALPETQAIEGAKRKGEKLSLEQQNQLRALEQINYILKTQGNLAGATAASELGMNPEVLFKDPTMIGKAIDALKTQMKDTPTFRQDMSKEELKSMTSLEQSRMSLEGTKYTADKNAEVKKAEAAARQAKVEAALSMDKLWSKYTQEYNAIANDPNVPQEQKDFAYEKVENQRQAIVSAKRDPQLTLDPGLQGLIMSNPAQSQPTKKLHQSSATPAPKGSGNSLLTPEQRAKIIKDLQGR
jgi:hypothetical protein